MDHQEIFNLFGNGLALVTLISKTIFDLIINNYLVKNDEKSMSAVGAAERKKSRADLSLTFTFIFLALSYILLILGAFNGQ